MGNASNTWGALVQRLREEEREKAASYLEAEARKHEEAAQDLEREDDEEAYREARMHRLDAASLYRHAAVIRGSDQ